MRAYWETFWTKQEIELLKQGVQLHDRDWKKISDHIGSHQTPLQCSEKASKLKLHGNQGNWTYVETEKMIEAFKLYGPDWEKINEHVGTKRSLIGVRNKAAMMNLF